jgi:hypothetical protein
MELDHQSSRDFDALIDNPTLGGLGSAGPPGQLHGGVDMSSSNFGRPLAPNMAGQPAYQSSEFALGATQTRSMNPGLNPSSPSHMVAQKHQWDTSNHFPPTPATQGTSIGILSQLADRRALLLAGIYSQGPVTSHTQPQANRGQPTIPFEQARHEPGANHIRISSTNNRGIEIRDSAPVGVPLANSGLPVLGSVPTIDESHNRDEGSIRCVLHSALV